jgi:hypothetical protein
MSRWIRDEAGVRVPVTTRGLLIGRSSACGLVVSDPRVSRRHALVLRSAEAIQVVPLSPSGVTIRGQIAREPAVVRHDDEITVGRARLFVEIGAEQAQIEANWLLGIGERRYPVHKPRFSVGGAADDDLVVASWPARACVLHASCGALLLELDDARAATVSEEPAGVGLYRLGHGARFARDSIEIIVLRAGDEDPTAPQLAVPTDVALELVPNGALLRVRLSQDHTTFLPQLRADLIAALLRTGGGQRPGDWIEDDVLIARVWGRQGATRAQLNVLVHRTRRSLADAGLDGAALLQRVQGGGATRFQLAEGARVSIG